MKGWSGGGKEERVVSGDGAQDVEQNIYHTEIIVVDEQISGTATGDTTHYGAFLLVCSLDASSEPIGA